LASNIQSKIVRDAFKLADTTQADTLTTG